MERFFFSNVTGNVGPPSCVGQATQWMVTQEQVGKVKNLTGWLLSQQHLRNSTAVVLLSIVMPALHYNMFSLVPQIALRVRVRLDRSLRLCSDNETDPECCLKPLCVLETLQLSACVNGTPQASVLIQARIHAQLHPVTGSGRSCSSKSLHTVVRHRKHLRFSHPPVYFHFFQLQSSTQQFQTSLTKRLGHVPATSRSAHVMFAAAAIRYFPCWNVFQYLNIAP